MFEPVVFRKQIYCIEESACDIVGSSQRPLSDSAPGELFTPCPSTLRPWAGKVISYRQTPVLKLIK